MQSNRPTLISIPEEKKDLDAESHDSQGKTMFDLRLSDHEPVIDGNVCSLNLLCQCDQFKNGNFNNGFKIVEDNIQYKKRLDKLVQQIKHIYDTYHIDIFLFQEAPNPDTTIGKNFYLALKNILPHFPNHFIKATMGTRSCLFVMANIHYYPTQEMVPGRLYERKLRIMEADRGQMICLTDKNGKTHTIVNVHASYTEQLLTLKDIQYCIENEFLIGGDFNINTNNADANKYKDSLSNQHQLQEKMLPFFVKCNAIDSNATYDGIIDGTTHKLAHLLFMLEKENATPLLPLITPEFIKSISSVKDLDKLLSALQKANYSEVHSSNSFSFLIDKFFTKVPIYDSIAEQILNHFSELIHKDTSNFLINNKSYTLNHHAAHYGANAILKELIRRNKTIDQIAEYGRTPLHIAVFRGNVDSVRLLIELNANVNLAEKFRESFNITSTFKTPIMLAVEQAILYSQSHQNKDKEKFINYLEIIVLLLKTNKVSINRDMEIQYLTRLYGKLNDTEKEIFTTHILSLFDGYLLEANKKSILNQPASPTP